MTWHSALWHYNCSSGLLIDRAPCCFRHRYYLSITLWGVFCIVSHYPQFNVELVGTVGFPQLSFGLFPHFVPAKTSECTAVGCKHWLNASLLSYLKELHCHLRSLLQNCPAFNCEEVLQRIPPGVLRIMCHVSQRLNCPLKDMVINALCVIARRRHSPLRQSGTQDTHLHPKVRNPLSGRPSAPSAAF